MTNDLSHYEQYSRTTDPAPFTPVKPTSEKLEYADLATIDMKSEWNKQRSCKLKAATGQTSQSSPRKPRSTNFFPPPFLSLSVFIQLSTRAKRSDRNLLFGSKRS